MKCFLIIFLVAMLTISIMSRHRLKSKSLRKDVENCEESKDGKCAQCKEGFVLTENACVEEEAEEEKPKSKRHHTRADCEEGQFTQVAAEGVEAGCFTTVEGCTAYSREGKVEQCDTCSTGEVNKDGSCPAEKKPKRHHRKH